ncbi:MAG: 2-hydroxyacyl-CoA dehydratase [Thermoleophilia bacterium]
MSRTCYYTCNLVPPTFLERAGFVPRSLLGCSVDGGADTDGTGMIAKPTITPHPNSCPYVVQTLAVAEAALSAESDALLVVPSGCDAMRRAGDALRARFHDRVYAYSVPRTSDAGSVAALARDLDRLWAWLGAAAAAGRAHGAATQPDAVVAQSDAVAGKADGEVAQPDADQPDPAADSPGAPPEGGAARVGTFAYPRPPQPGGVFVMGGPMSHPALSAAVEALGVTVSGVETYRGPECGALLTEFGRPELNTGDIAALLLEAPRCPRCSAGPRREYLRGRLRESGASAVLYARLPFCDPGAYDATAVQTLAEEEGVPFLELEVGYPLEIDGRLRVRIEAFLETLTLADSLLDDVDDLFEDSALEDPPATPSGDTTGATGAATTDHPRTTRASSRGNGKNGGGESGLLAASLTRKAVAARAKALALRSGTARAHLEHYALTAGLQLYKPGAFVPWVSYLFPPEIMASYGLTPLIPEVVAATLSGTDFRDQLEAAMNRLPTSRDICSYHRATKAALAARLIPPPTVCLGTTPLCLGKECMLDTTASELGVPFRSVRVPLPPDEGPTPLDDIADVAEQLHQIHDYLGTLTGRKPDLERAALFSNRASAVWSDISDRRLNGDLVLNGRRAFGLTFLGQMLWGSEAGAKGFERLRSVRGRHDLEIAEISAVGRGARVRPLTSRVRGGNANGSTAGPRPRILWLHTMPHNDPTLFDLIQVAGGAVVFEEMGRVHLDPLDPTDPFPGMARRLIEHPLWGSATRRARLVLDLVRLGDIDGVIHYNHWGCRHGLGTLPVLRDALHAAAVPFLALDGDALDQPGHGAENSARQLESFLEML